MFLSARKHRFAVFFLIYLMVNLGLDFGETLISPFAKTLGATPLLIGVVATGFTYGSLAFRFISGPIMDFFSRKRLLVGAVAIIAFSFLGEVFSTSVSMLVFFRILQGVGQAFTAPICLTLAAGVVSRKRIASGIGVLAIARGIATLFAPMIALKMSEVTGYRKAFLAAVVIELISIVIVLLIPSGEVCSEAKNKKKTRICFSNFLVKEAALPSLMQFFFMMAWSCVFAFLVVYGLQQGWGSNVGLFNTVYGLVVFVAAPLGGYLVDRFGTLLLLPMLALMSVSLWILSFSSSLAMLILAAAVGAFGYGAAGPVVRSMTMSAVPVDRRGAASSTFFIASDIGQLLGPVVGGVLISFFGYAVMFRIAPIWVLCAAILLISVNRKKVPISGDEMEKTTS